MRWPLITFFQCSGVQGGIQYTDVFLMVRKKQQKKNITLEPLYNIAVGFQDNFCVTSGKLVREMYTPSYPMFIK